MIKPLAIDLFCGLGGWTDGLLAEGWDVIGFDIERHRYPKYAALDYVEEGQKSLPGSNSNAPRWSDRSATGPRDMAIKAMRDSEPTGGWHEYPAQLVLQSVLTLHGSQFREASLIVASPPCQEYSYMAMPWSPAKQKRAEYLNGTRDRKDLTALFDACFRIQREAIEAAGHHIPLVVENVRGAQEWVGRSRWNYGSFHLWGDVPALMPIPRKANRQRDDGAKTPEGNCSEPLWKDRPIARLAHPTPSEMEAHGFKVPGFRFDGSGKSFQTTSVDKTGSKSKARKAASAAIAKIPMPLARHIASIYKP